MQPQTAVMDGGVPEGMLQRDSVVYCGNVVYDRGEVRLLTDEGYVTLDDGRPTCRLGLFPPKLEKWRMPIQIPVLQAFRME